MNCKLCVLVVAALSINNAASQKDFSLPSANLNLMSLMSRSNGAMNGNPARSYICFATLMPNIQNITRSYEESHSKCLEVYDATVAEINESATRLSEELAYSAEETCNSFDVCKRSGENLVGFQCYGNKSSENIDKLKNTLDNAKPKLFALKDKSDSIHSRKKKCIEEKKWKYESDYRKCFSYLDSCINKANVISFEGMNEYPMGLEDKSGQH